MELNHGTGHLFLRSAWNHPCAHADHVFNSGANIDVPCGEFKEHGSGLIHNRQLILYNFRTEASPFTLMLGGTCLRLKFSQNETVFLWNRHCKAAALWTWSQRPRMTQSSRSRTRAKRRDTILEINARQPLRQDGSRSFPRPSIPPVGLDPWLSTADLGPGPGPRPGLRSDRSLNVQNHRRGASATRVQSATWPPPRVVLWAGLRGPALLVGLAPSGFLRERYGLDSWSRRKMIAVLADSPGHPLVLASIPVPGL